MWMGRECGLMDGFSSMLDGTMILNKFPACMFIVVICPKFLSLMC